MLSKEYLVDIQDLQLTFIYKPVFKLLLLLVLSRPLKVTTLHRAKIYPSGDIGDTFLLPFGSNMVSLRIGLYYQKEYFQKRMKKIENNKKLKIAVKKTILFE